MKLLSTTKNFFQKVKNSKIEIPFSVLFHNISLIIDGIFIYKAKKKNDKKGLIIYSIIAGIDGLVLLKKISNAFKPEEEIIEEGTTLDDISDEEFLKEDEGDDE